MPTVGSLIDAARNRKLTENEVRALRMAFDTQRSRRPAMEVSPLRRPRWWKLLALFDGPAKRVMDMSGSPVLLQGTVSRDGEDELAVCLVPPATGPTQGEALRVLLEANLRTPTLVLSSNIHLCKLKQIGEAEAREIMSAAAAQAKPPESSAIVQTGTTPLPSTVPTAEMEPVQPDEIIMPECPEGQDCNESCPKWTECASATAAWDVFPSDRAPARATDGGASNDEFAMEDPREPRVRIVFPFADCKHDYIHIGIGQQCRTCGAVYDANTGEWLPGELGPGVPPLFADEADEKTLALFQELDPDCNEEVEVEEENPVADEEREPLKDITGCDV